MTAEKVDLQRGVVRNERRQSYENTPYGAAELVVPEAMYPPGHPYHHPVIGSHADLEAASLQDVKDFFRSWYVPANATLVVAGDFDPDAVRPLVEQLYGAIPAAPAPAPAAAAPARLTREVRRVVTDQVELPKLILAWHAPAAFAPGTAELDLLADVLGEGLSSRLVRRLVQDLRIAESVAVYQEDRALGSLFRIEVTGTPGADLEQVKREVLAAVAQLAEKGPTAPELRRVKAQAQLGLLSARENLTRRADRLNLYRTYLGVPDGFALDLARYQRATAAGLRDAARSLGAGRLDLRVLPAGAAGQIPDARPADLAARPFQPPAPSVFQLASGVEVRAVPLPGTGLFTAHLLFPGGARAVPAKQAGLASILAELLTSGAGGRSGPDFADAAGALGASFEASATPGFLQLSVAGLSANLLPTLDLLADAARRPNLTASDCSREAALALARVEARPDDPHLLGPVVAAAALWGRDDPRGRPVDGWAETVRGITRADLAALAPRLLDPRGAVLVVAGDFEVAALRKALEARLGDWRGAGAPPALALPPARPAPGGRLVLVDRPGAPQTFIVAVRPAEVLDEPARAVRSAVNTVLGGSFTSRLNQNLREQHGYTYGVRSGFQVEGGQATFATLTSVQTEVTGPALVELRRELDGLAAGGPTSEETAKARELVRHDLVEAAGTSHALAAFMAGAVREGRPAGALAADAAALARVDAAAAVAEARSGPYGFGGLTVVLVGDRARVLPQLQQAGLPAPVEAGVDGALKGEPTGQR
ncbi:MAG: pitrilysin family protein [Anaeromyxobacter sp.]